VHEQLLELFDGVRLTPTQRRIATSLLEHAPTAAYLSSAEVAELARVSQPSVTRFATALGYDGYPALRRALRDAVVASTAGTRAGDAPTGTGGGTGNDLQRAVSGEIDHLSRLRDRLTDGSPDRGLITRAAALLAASDPLPVLGLRAAAPVAGYVEYFASKIHPDVRALTHGGSLLHDHIGRARAAGATALLAVVLPRYPRESLDALHEARAAGLSTVVLTDTPLSPAAALADVALCAPVGARLVFDLYTAPMTLAMVLLQAMCDALPERTQSRLEDFETSAARRGVFLP